MNNLIAYKGATYITDLTVYAFPYASTYLPHMDMRMYMCMRTYMYMYVYVYMYNVYVYVYVW